MTHRDTQSRVSEIQILNRVSKFLKDITSVTAAFEKWGLEFTIDCTKEKRGTHGDWFVRKVDRLRRVADRTRQRVGC